MAPSPDSRTGVAAILAGVLIFAGRAGELAFGMATGWPVSTRIGRIGWRVAVAGVVLLGLFAVQALITVALTGDTPGNFILFGLGFLLLFVGHVLIASGLREALGRAWVLPLVGAAGILVAITLDDEPIEPIHDIGLFVFEGAWIALGIALMRTERKREAGTAAG